MDNNMQQPTIHKPGHRFPKGVSGNPKGRPKGSRNRSTLLAQALLDSRAEALVTKVVQLALEGDFNCLRFCLERLIPPKKDAPIDFSLPELQEVSDIRKLFSSVAASLDKGGITPGEAKVLVNMGEAFQKLLEMIEIESRVSALEKSNGVGRRK